MMTTQALLPLIKDYQNGKALTAIAKELNIDWSVLKKHFILNGVEIRGRKKHNLNKRYFETVDSYEKAYFLGLLFADGGITKFRKDDESVGKITISLVNDDSYILEEIRKSIGSSNELYNVKKEGNRQNQRKLQIADKEFVKNVFNLGMKPNKTYGGGLPIIEEKYIWSFILGFFDGDGSFVAWENKKRLERKCCYTFACHLDLALFFQKHFRKSGINSSIIPCKDTPIVHLVVNGCHQSLQIFENLYKNKEELPTFLKRKYFKALYFLIKYKVFFKKKYKMPKAMPELGYKKWMDNNMSKEQIDEANKELKIINESFTLPPGEETSKKFISELNEQFFSDCGVVL